MRAHQHNTAPPSGERDVAILTWMHEIAPYGIVTTDRDFHIVSWNQWMSFHSGLEENAVRGRSLLELYPDLRERRLDEHYRHALGGKVSVLATAFHHYLLGMPSTVRDSGFGQMQQTARIAPLRLEDAILGTITIIQDVTHREVQAAHLRQQHDHERLLSWALAFLLQARDPLDAAGQILQKVANALSFEIYAAYMLDADGSTLRLRASGGAPVGRDSIPPVESLDEGVAGRCARLRSPVLLSGIQQSRDVYAVIPRRLGIRAIAAFPMLVGSSLLGTLVFGTTGRDLIPPEKVEFLNTLTQYVAVAIERASRESALREAQDALRRHADDLENKVADRTAALNETIVQLESFSYTVAHDLRAPIRALTGYSDILLTDYRDQIPEDAKGMLRNLHRASIRLDALTRDLLRFSRVTREDLELAVVDVGELIAEIIQITPVLQRGVLTVRKPLHPVRAQRTLLQQCLSNLVDNALKFVAPGKPPRIEVYTEPAPSPAQPAGSDAAGREPTRPPGARRVRIVVADNGIGIPPESQERIFGIFERVGGSQFEGTGIGLAIVERAVHRMGGHCGVISQVGHGSRFWMELDAP